MARRPSTVAVVRALRTSRATLFATYVSMLLSAVHCRRRASGTGVRRTMNSSAERRNHPSFLTKVGMSGGSVGVPTPRASRGESPRGASAVAARWRMRPAVRRTCEPLSLLGVSRELNRIRVTYSGTATPMPSTFIAKLSVRSTMRCDSQAARRVKTDMVRIHTRGTESA